MDQTEGRPVLQIRRQNVVLDVLEHPGLDPVSTEEHRDVEQLHRDQNQPDRLHERVVAQAPHRFVVLRFLYLVLRAGALVRLDVELLDLLQVFLGLVGVWGIRAKLQTYPGQGRKFCQQRCSPRCSC